VNETAVPLPAGAFSAWLRAMRAALAGGAGMDVACGDCAGCCTSSYFIKVRAHEAETLRRISTEHFVNVDDVANGDRIMGYGANGHCPMYAPGGCTIYSHRPETCRTFDCRVFTAAGMPAGGDGKSIINERVARWQFEYPGDVDREEHRAVISAARYIRQHPIRLPGGRVPSRPSEVAVLAVKTYTVFLDPPRTDAEIVSAIIAAGRDFDRGATPT
jgi:uncharacterized protein